MRLALRLTSNAAQIAGSAWVILRRELVGLLRSRAVFWTTAAMLALTSAIPLSFWPEAGSVSASWRAIRAFELYRAVFWYTVPVLVTIVAASAVAGERARNTYDVLYATLLRPSGILLGKLLASIGVFSLFLFLSLPIISVLYLAGGFSAWDFVEFAVISTTVVVYAGVVALWCSTACSTTLVAIGRTVSIHLMLMFFIGLAWPIARYFVTPTVFLAAAFLVAGSVMWIAIVGNARYPTAPLRQPEKRGRRRQGPRPVRRRAFPALLRRMGVDSSDGSIPDRLNPVFVATLRSGAFGDVRGRRAFVWVLAFICGAVTYIAHSNAGTAAGIVGAPIACILYLAACLVPGAGTPLVVSEEHIGNIDLLRQTPLTPAEILRGKLLTILFGFSSVAAVLAAFVPFLLLLGLPRAEGFHDRGQALLAAAWALPALLSILALASTAGLLAGALSRRRVVALPIAYAISLGVLVVPIGFQGIDRRLSMGSPPWSVLREMMALMTESTTGGRVAVAVAIALGLAGLLYLLACAAARRWPDRDR